MTKNIFKLVFCLLSIALIASCSDKGNTTDVFTKLYPLENLTTQTYTIDNSKNNLLTGQLGTILRINKNLFVDKNGKAVTGNIEIKLIEALRSIDRVLGNLTTVFENKLLETGGMIYVNATSNNEPIYLATNKSIEIKMPTDSALLDMSVFEGIKDSIGIEWKNPILIPKRNDSTTFSFEKTTNITYSVEGFENEKSEFPEIVNSEVSRIAWEGDGLKISRDSVLKIDKYVVHFYKNNKLQTWSQVFNIEKGTNSYVEDPKLNYFFSIKKLGWANIDRLLADPRTKEVELVTSIENEDDFKLIYVTLITQKMYLPGYQKKDETFCFSHNDEEKQMLPVGETATILATAYKENKPYFAIKKITITDNQKVSFKLEETTTEKFKTELQEKI